MDTSITSHDVHELLLCKTKQLSFLDFYIASCCFQSLIANHNSVFYEMKYEVFRMTRWEAASIWELPGEPEKSFHSKKFIPPRVLHMIQIPVKSRKIEVFL